MLRPKKLQGFLGDCMRLIQKKSSYSLRSTFRNLFEQGLFGDEAAAGGDDAAKKDEPADEAKEDKPEEGGDEKAAGDEKEGGEEKDKEEPKVYVSKEDEARLADVVDQEIVAVLIDFETNARKAAVIDNRMMQGESRFRSIKRFLLEDAADDIDLKSFAADVARLVKNYDTLLDMKSIILNRAFSYILSKYGKETEKALKDVLEQDHRLVSNEPIAGEDDEPEVPVAVGARKPE